MGCLSSIALGELMKQLAWVNDLHIPTYVVAFVLYVIGQFTLTANGGQVLDLSTNEGRVTAAGILIGILIKALQVSPVTPTKA
jgi:hypothetical protein